MKTKILFKNILYQNPINEERVLNEYAKKGWVLKKSNSFYSKLEKTDGENLNLFSHLFFLLSFYIYLLKELYETLFELFFQLFIQKLIRFDLNREFHSVIFF